MLNHSYHCKFLTEKYIILLYHNIIYLEGFMMIADLRSAYSGDFDEAIVNLSNYELNVLRAILEASDVTVCEALEIIEDGTYMFYETDSFDEFIDMLIEDEIFGEISPTLEKYLDYDMIKIDLEFDGYTMTSVGIVRID